MEDAIKKLYTNVGSPFAFGGVDRLYNGAKKLGYNISKYRIKKLLQSIFASSIFKKLNKLYNCVI